MPFTCCILKSVERNAETLIQDDHNIIPGFLLCAAIGVTLLCCDSSGIVVVKIGKIICCLIVFDEEC